MQGFEGSSGVTLLRGTQNVNVNLLRVSLAHATRLGQGYCGRGTEYEFDTSDPVNYGERVCKVDREVGCRGTRGYQINDEEQSNNKTRNEPQYGNVIVHF